MYWIFWDTARYRHIYISLEPPQPTCCCISAGFLRRNHLIECIDLLSGCWRLRREIPSVSGAEEVETEGLAEAGGGEGAAPVVAFAISVTSLEFPKAST